MATGPIASVVLEYTPVMGDIGNTVTLLLNPSVNGANTQPFYSCEEPNNSYEVVSVQFIAAPPDVSAANVLVNGVITGTVSGASTYGPQGMNKGDRIAVQVPNITSADVGNLIAVAIVGYWQDSKPEPWPIPASGGLGAPPSSAGPATPAPFTRATTVTGGGPQTVVMTGASIVALAANANRLGGYFMAPAGNTDPVYLSFGGAASAASFTVELVPGAYYEMPQPVYAGNVNAFGASGADSLLVTETTP